MLQAVTSNATFDPALTFNTDVGFDLALSPDKKTFTATFGGFEVIIGATSASPIVTRVYSFSIPLKDTEPGQEIPFFVQGFAELGKGTSAHLVLAVNDQSAMAYIPPGLKDDAPIRDGFVHQLNYKATGAAEAKVTIFLLVNRDSKLGSGAYLNVSSIDTDATRH
jgi:hypothetical protein